MAWRTVPEDSRFSCLIMEGESKRAINNLSANQQLTLKTASGIDNAANGRIDLPPMSMLPTGTLLCSKTNVRSSNKGERGLGHQSKSKKDFEKRKLHDEKNKLHDMEMR